MKTPYTQAIEQTMKGFFDSLSEKDKRRYAAVEAQKLGHSGITYLSKLLGCSRSTIYVGLNEVGVSLEKKEIHESGAKEGDVKATP